jgi:hypothetical protein
LLLVLVLFVILVELVILVGFWLLVGLENISILILYYKQMLLIIIHKFSNKKIYK